MASEVVVITGASAGVGRATAREFAKKGSKIGLIARDRARLEITQREVERLGGQAAIFPLDVADSQAVEEAAEELTQRFGPIDAWINNAMASVFSLVREMTADEYRRVTEVTYLGYVHGTLAALKRMLPRDDGVIVQVGSALAHRSIPLQSAYCAAKHAIAGFTESLRTELLHEGSRIRVTMVNLPAINTPQFEWVKSRLPFRAQPVPPIFQPEVAARAIVWSVSHPRRQIWVGGSTVLAILAEKFAPGIADRVLARKGIEAQQTSERANPLTPHNLWEPVPGDWAAHGRFDERSHPFSAQSWLNRNRGGILAFLIMSWITWRGFSFAMRGRNRRAILKEGAFESLATRQTTSTHIRAPGMRSLLGGFLGGGPGAGTESGALR